MSENIINEIKKGLPSKLDEKAKELRDFRDFTSIQPFIIDICLHVSTHLSWALEEGIESGTRGQQPDH